jgi:hypothetical protein
MRVLVFWAGLLALWTIVQLAFRPHAITLILLGGSALAVVLVAFVARLARPPRQPSGDLAPAAIMLAMGIAALLSGTELGTWCIALGALVTAAALVALVLP